MTAANPLAVAALATAFAAIISALVGAAALRYTAAQSQATEIQARTTADQVSQAGLGQLTDRYTRAVAQLGDSSLDVRVGGIYALERLARDSPYDDQRTIVYVLGTYIADHAPDASSAECAAATRNAADVKPTISSDVAAAIVVLSRRDPSRDDYSRVDLSHLCLTNLDIFRGVNVGLDLRSFYLSSADLAGSHLRGARLNNVNLSGANLSGTDLTGANLAGANLAGADLTGANLAGATLN